MRLRPLSLTLLALSIAACGKQGADSNAVGGEVAANTNANVAPPPGGDWTQVVSSTGDGIAMGNPNAKVKLTEIASLGCPFCKRFEDEGVPEVMKLVKAGQVQWEFRPFIIHGPVDVAANLIARCNGPQGFFPMSAALYREQAKWMGQFEKAPQDRVARIQNLPPTEAFVEAATLAGLQDVAAQNGLPSAKANQCLADQAAVDREVAATANAGSQFPEFKGTPGFAINGQFVPDASAWAEVKPALEAALR
ncbi:DsbA family protein [Sphingomonas glaciei]|uniref:DsbA family protein n=1 Tax=Sphingomonas glaciei TaxID=2938948 RepID=A0ABY5MR11_9SPHN|nr:thioredoxin domain-containing protein [Sphingomonas glaciei]UUR06925.1 DsbA family protein [Sphingomonas glaciei]